MSAPRATTVCRCGTGAFCHQHKRQRFGPAKPKITAEDLAEALATRRTSCLRSREELLALAQDTLDHLEGRTDEADR